MIRRNVLMVATTPSLTQSLLVWLRALRCDLTIARTYAAAKCRLETDPHVLITELELGDYNGLQLALRARNKDIPAIVIGPDDVVLEHEAEQLGALYLRRSRLSGDTLSNALTQLISDFSSPYADVEFVWTRFIGGRSSSGSRRVVVH